MRITINGTVFEIPDNSQVEYVEGIIRITTPNVLRLPPPPVASPPAPHKKGKAHGEPDLDEKIISLVGHEGVYMNELYHQTNTSLSYAGFSFRLAKLQKLNIVRLDKKHNQVRVYPPMVRAEVEGKILVALEDGEKAVRGLMREVFGPDVTPEQRFFGQRLLMEMVEQGRIREITDKGRQRWYSRVDNIIRGAYKEA